MMSPETKKRIVDILLTALAGALIAFLQSILTGLAGLDIAHANPELAAGAAGTIKTALSFVKRSA